MYFKHETHRNFQFKFLQRRIVTNVFLFKIQAADIDLCCFSQGTRANKRVFTFFGIVPCQELLGIMPKISWFQLICRSLWRFRKIKCLGPTGKERDVLFIHCHCFSCKYKRRLFQKRRLFA